MLSVAVLKEIRALHDKFDALSVKVGGHDKRLDAHDKRFDAIDKRFDAIDQKLVDVKEDVHRLSIHQEVTDTKLDRILEVVIAGNERFDRMLPKISKISNHEHRISALEATVRDKGAGRGD